MQWREKISGPPFNPYLTKESLLAMILQKKEEKLILSSKGVFLRSKKRSWPYFQNKKHEKEARLKVFTTFCHPLKNPIYKPYLRLVLQKTNHFAQRALEAIELQIGHEEKKDLQAIIQGYEKATIYQLRLISLMERVVKRRHHPLVDEAKKALEEGKTPVRPSHGASGSYFMPGIAHTITGLFKPYDEEIGAPNNPRKISLRGVLGKKSRYFQIAVGEGALREMAAFEIDRALKLSIVPYTTCVDFEHPLFFDNAEGMHLQASKKKIGSFQQFRAGFYHIYEVSERALEGITLDALQRVVILDILLGNQDRNGSNLLTNGHEVVAIDHGYSLSPSLLRVPLLRKFRNLPQMQQPFLPFLQEKVQNFPIEKLLWKLRKKAFIDESSLERFQERLALLLACIDARLSVNLILDLMHPRYLKHLYGLKNTLNNRAKMIISWFKKYHQKRVLL